MRGCLPVFALLLLVVIVVVTLSITPGDAPSEWPPRWMCLPYPADVCVPITVVIT